MLASLKEVLEEGKRRGIAIGSFNTPTLENMFAVTKAAEKLGVPVIIMHAQIHESVVPIEDIGKVMVFIAKESKTKVCVHLDHGEDPEYVKTAIRLGFTSVMIDYSTLEYNDNVKRTAEVVKYAHEHGVDVEGELGKLPSREGGDDVSSAIGKQSDLYTDPELVNDYISRTGVDALAIAFGTAHGIYTKPPVLNLDIISKVREKTNIPLVMHGGSGINDATYKEVIKRGVSKINYYTYMSYAGYDTARNMTKLCEKNFYHDIAASAQKTMVEHAERVIRVFSNMEQR